MNESSHMTKPCPAPYRPHLSAHGGAIWGWGEQIFLWKHFSHYGCSTRAMAAPSRSLLGPASDAPNMLSYRVQPPTLRDTPGQGAARGFVGQWWRAHCSGTSSILLISHGVLKSLSLLWKRQIALQLYSSCCHLNKKRERRWEEGPGICVSCLDSGHFVIMDGYTAWGQSAIDLISAWGARALIPSQLYAFSVMVSDKSCALLFLIRIVIPTFDTFIHRLKWTYGKWKLVRITSGVCSSSIWMNVGQCNWFFNDVRRRVLTMKGAGTVIWLQIRSISGSIVITRPRTPKDVNSYKLKGLSIQLSNSRNAKKLPLPIISKEMILAQCIQ